MNNQYIAGGFFIVRTPLFSIDKYRSSPINEKDYLKFLEEIIKNTHFKEAVKFASPDLYETITNFLEKNKPLSVNAYQSISNYFIRMTTRTTPFGLFSGIGMGFFGDKTEISVDTHKSKKYIRADMGWLSGLVDTYEDKRAFFLEYEVIFNPNTYISGNRFVNPHKSIRNKSEEKSIVSTIKLTQTLISVQKKAYTPIKLKHLSEYLCEENPQVPTQVIEGYLFKLVKEEFLISKLRPQIINTNSLLMLANVVSGNKEEIKQLDNIIANIKEYENIPLEQETDYFFNICKNMKGKYANKAYLQIDTKVCFKQCTISNEHKNNLEELASFLINLSEYVIPSNTIESYKNEFIERYGTAVFVPITELLDDNVGLGSPKGYRYPVTKKRRNLDETKTNSVLRKLILDKTFNALQSDSIQIELSEADLQNLKTYYKHNFNKQKPKDFELNFFVNQNKKAINQFILGPNKGSLSAGKTFGRFTHLFTENELKEVDKLYLQKHKVYENELIVEIQEAPIYPKNANVMGSSHVHADYILSMGNIWQDSEKSININDIYVGIDKNTDNLCLYSKIHKKKIYAQMSTMLNWTGCSNIVRLMLDITTYGFATALEVLFDLELESDNDILTPRIVYKNIVLQPATWRISRFNIQISENFNAEEVRTKLNSYLKQWRVPRYVYLKEYDNLLLIDTQNSFHLNEIVRRLQRNAVNVTLQEVTIMEDMDENSFFTEISVPFFLNKELEKNEMIKETNPHFETDFYSRKMFPFNSEWVYLKLYLDTLRYDDFFDSTEIFMNKLYSSGFINKYFFVRYFDEAHHVRLRINIKNNSLNIVLNEITMWCEEMFNIRLLNNISYNIYDRELERYGGFRLMDTAEDFFCIDSKYALTLLRLEKEQSLKFNFKIYAVMGIIDILIAFESDITKHINKLKGYRRDEDKKHLGNTKEICLN